MDGCHFFFVRKTNNLLQRMDGCHYKGENERLPLKNWMSKVTLPKVVPPLNPNYCQRLSVPYNP